MSLRDRAASWVWALLVAAPLVGLFILAKRNSGWIATTAWVGVWLCLAGMFVAMLVYQVRAWREMEEEFDRRDLGSRDPEDP